MYKEVGKGVWREEKKKKINEKRRDKKYWKEQK